MMEDGGIVVEDANQCAFCTQPGVPEQAIYYNLGAYGMLLVHHISVTKFENLKQYLKMSYIDRT
jgi:hypothetical protein